MPSVSQKQANLMSAIKHGWHPPSGMHAPSLKVATEFHEADKKVGKYMHADGGSITDPDIQRGILLARSHPQSKTNKFLALVSHAADRATSTVTDDPHHALARVASGLASQVAGQTRSGRVEFGRLPNLVDEIKSLPAGVTDLGLGAANLLGGLSDKYINTHMPGTVGDTLSRLRDAANAYVEKHGDPAPQWSRDAEARANAMHGSVNKLMGLSNPKGFIENAADATGTMLGQLPIPGAEAKTVTRGGKAGLAALAKAIPEYLGPTVRPSLRNYATGALGGGALGALASPAEAAPVPPPEGGPPMNGRFE